MRLPCSSAASWPSSIWSLVRVRVLTTLLVFGIDLLVLLLGDRGCHIINLLSPLRRCHRPLPLARSFACPDRVAFPGQSLHQPAFLVYRFVKTKLIVVQNEEVDLHEKNGMSNSKPFIRSDSLILRSEPLSCCGSLSLFEAAICSLT
jgi:hypothetical protein